ncbi:MAG: agmatinase [Deltaproteobacteria bacterium]|jgi:agmatinase|nr:agmatinase [Deltaproteobacteria bacterium]
MNQEFRLLSMPNVPIGQADLIVLPIPLERTVSFKPGTASAPHAILETTDQLEFYDEDANWSPFNHIKLCVLPPFDDNPSLCDDDWHQSLRQHVANLPSNNLLISLGGEHSITPSLVDARMKAPGTVLFFDAHADMRRTYQGSKYSHACPVFRLIEQGHRIITAGIRSICESEAALVHHEPQITQFKDRELQDQQTWTSFLQIVHELKGPVYLSIDMDVFNPAEVPGVGTPQPGGLSWRQMIEILETLFSNPELMLRGADIVELVPEPSRVSEMVAAKLLHRIVSLWGKNQGYDSRPLVGSQTQVDCE